MYVGETPYLRNVHLFLGDVAGDVNHLHAVTQRFGDRVSHVRRADKQHLKDVSGCEKSY